MTLEKEVHSQLFHCLSRLLLAESPEHTKYALFFCIKCVKITKYEFIYWSTQEVTQHLFPFAIGKVIPFEFNIRIPIPQKLFGNP